MMIKRRHIRVKLDDTKFMAIWNTCETIDEFSQKTTMKPDTAAHRAVRLRKAGYTLKSLRKDQDYTALASYIASIEQGKAKLSAREIILLYMVGVKMKSVATVTGKNEMSIKNKVRVCRNNLSGLKRLKSLGKTDEVPSVDKPLPETEALVELARVARDADGLDKLVEYVTAFSILNLGEFLQNLGGFERFEELVALLRKTQVDGG